MVILLVAPLVATLINAPVALAGDQQTPPPPPVMVTTPEGETREIVLKDGTTAIGRVEQIDESRITFRTSSGAVMQLDASQVIALREAKGRVVNGEFWKEDSNTTRLFFTPTGRALKKGDAYFGVYEVMMPFVQVGVTDRISIGGGTPLFFGGGGAPPFWVTPKVQVVRSKTTQAAVGLLHFMNIGDYKMGIAYGVATVGNADSAFTAGAGYAYARGDEDGDKGGAPVLMIGGENRISRRTKFITENYFFPDGGILSGGVRFLGEHLSVDFGLLTPLGADVFVVMPMINFVKSF